MYTTARFPQTFFFILLIFSINIFAQNETNVLEAGKPIERELKGGENHDYQITLASGQFLHVVAEQNGIDVVVALFAPDGKKLVEVDSPNGTSGEEPIWFISETGGEYRLVVNSLEKGAKAGHYSVKINEVRASISDDKFFVAGKKAMSEAELLANENNQESRIKAAEKLEEASRSFRQIEDKQRKAFAIIHIARTYESLNDSATAIPYFQEAKILFEETGLKIRVAASYLSLGLNYYNLHMTDKALDSFKQALAIGKSIGNLRMQADSLNKIAATYFTLGEIPQSISTFQEMLSVSKEGDYKIGQFEALSNIGIVYEKQHNFIRALEYTHKALKLQEEWGGSEDATTLLTLGNIYTGQGNFPQALYYFQRALSGFEKENSEDTAVGLGYTTNNIGSLYFNMGEYDKALEYYLKARQLKAVTFLGEEPTSLRNIGDVYAHLGKYPEALEYQQKALDFFLKAENLEEIATTYKGLAFTYFAMADFPKSLEFAEKSGKIALERDFPTTYWTALNQMAASQLKLGQKKEAKQSLESAIRKIESLRLQVAGNESALQNYSKVINEPFYKMVGLLIEENLDAEAFSYAERAKARTLLDVLQNGKIEITKAMTLQEREQEEKFKNEIVLLNTRISNEKDKDRLNELNKQLDKKRLEFEDFQTRLYAIKPELKVQRGEIKSISLEESAKLLSDDKSALLEYVVAEDKSFLFVIAKDATRKVSLKAYPIEIKQKDLSERAESFRAKLAKGDLDFSKQARDLYDLLLKPAEVQLKNKTNLTIVPDSALWDLPFQALQSTQNKYLIETAAVSYAPSLTALREMAKKNKGKQFSGATLLAFGNPSVGKETSERVRQVFMSEKLEPLPEAERLVMNLGNLYGANQSKIFVGADAREETAKSESSKYRIVQFAAHGILNNVSPMYSHIVLAQKQDNPAEDGLLEAWEMKDLDLNADMVILSACETARGKLSSGEGVIGMSWALFIAGAPTTVASQWKVESSSTTELMLEFHRQLLTGKNISKAEALRRAELKLLKTQNYKHPSYWAGFVIVGEGF